jgi:dethiobiotin synthetase
MSELPGLFITASDTGAGKTYLATKLAQALTAQGRVVAARKPVESGCDEVDGQLMPLDAHALRLAAGAWEPLASVCPNPLHAPLSPPRAARFMKRKLFLADILISCTKPQQADLLLVEGAGGFFAPIAEDALNADLAAALGLPVLLVVPDRLGAINQALLGIHAITHRGLNLAGVVLNQCDADRPRGMDNVADLRLWTGAPIMRVDYLSDANSLLKTLAQ